MHAPDWHSAGAPCQQVMQAVGHQKMKIFFIDDSKQNNPSRPKMGPMVAVGGFVVDANSIRPLEDKIEEVCSKYNFPNGEVFKWSPGLEHWMRKNLVEENRKEFLIEIISALSRFECKLIFIAEDCSCSPACKSTNHELDAVKLLIERVEWYLSKNNCFGLIICDRPRGNYKQEESFLLDCLCTLKTGTDYIIPQHIAMSVLTSPFRLSRLLQAADIITSCTLAYVCGEKRYSKAIFEHLSPLFIRENGRTGGVGVKLHPFQKYGNFYHWLFGDSHYVKGTTGYPMPLPNIAFSENIETY